MSYHLPSKSAKRQAMLCARKTLQLPGVVANDEKGDSPEPWEH